MSSIFIWKSQAPNTSKKTIRYYSGSNWALEDNDYSSKSYMYLEQSVFSNIDYFSSAIVYNIKMMPQDWVGSELLEVTQLPYQLIKEDSYGLLENIGEWMKFTLKNAIAFEKDVLEQELSKIKDWINTENIVQTQKKDNYVSPRPTYQNRQPVQQSQRYLQSHKPHNPQNQYTPPNYQRSPRQEYKQQIELNREEIKNNFQNFLDKYNLPNIQTVYSQVQSTYVNNVYNEGYQYAKDYNKYNKHY